MTAKNSTDRIAILGCGNLGQSIARGLANSGKFSPEQIIVTDRNLDALQSFVDSGFQVQSDNRDAVKSARTVIISVQPGQLPALLSEIKSDFYPEHHIVVSTVLSVSVDDYLKQIGKALPVVRVMPNTAISVGESMTTVASHPENSAAIEHVVDLFNLMGTALVIDENQMSAATALCSCGIAFFLRTIRAASEGGVEIGFHAEEAIRMAAQTARGAATLLLESGEHPEAEIDKVTTPGGVTIAGLNQMEHAGLSSAMMQGIVTSAKMAEASNSGDESE